MHVTDILARALEDPDAVAALLGAIASDTSPGAAHLDAEQVAAAAEGRPDARAMAHALGCHGCASQIEAMVDLIGVDALPRPRPDMLAVRERPPALFATLHRTRNGALEVVHATGPMRVDPAVAVRSPSTPAALTLSDRPAHPSLEVGVVPDAGDGRMAVHVRWLGRAQSRLRARATSNGRVIAERELTDGAALLAGLRAGDVRIDIVDSARVVGLAWLRMGAQ